MTAVFGADLGNDFAKLGEKIRAFTGVKFDGGEDDDHERFGLKAGRGKMVATALRLGMFFEKLDEERIGNLLSRVASDEAAQIFITDTNCERLTSQLERLDTPFQLIQL